MYSEFAFSHQMQLVLAACTVLSTFCSLYLVAELILTFFDVTASRVQKLLFAFIAGTLLHNAWVYCIYFIGGSVSFNAVTYALVTSPNPIMAALYYVSAQKIFKLSPVRSIKLMSYTYLYRTLITTVYQLLCTTVFVQSGPRYNYLLDAMAVMISFALFIVSTKLIQFYVREHHARLRFVDTGIVYWRRETFSFFVRTLFVYVLLVATAVIAPGAVAGSIYVNVFIVMFIVLNLYMDLHDYDSQIINSQEVHISALFHGLEEFRGIKHDFYNILHTYSGYLELDAYDKLKTYHASLVRTTSHAGAMLDIAQRTQENPALVSLLIDKMTAAEKAGVKLMISLDCDLADFYIDTIDLTRVVACLLDNAIESAAESIDKRIYFTCKQMDPDAKLVIITNATGQEVDINTAFGYGITSKPGHSGIGLNTVQNTLNRYPNCTFRIQHFDQEFSVYVECRRF